MKCFNFKRTLMLVCRDIASDPRRWRNYLIFIYLAYAIPAIYITQNVRFGNMVTMDSALQSSAATISVITAFLATISASFTFTSMNSKTKRINVLTLPATNLEKYVSMLLEYVVLFFIASPIMLLLADLTQYVFFLVQGMDTGFLCPQVIEMTKLLTARDSAVFTMTEAADYYWQIQSIMLLAGLCRIATFVLGSAIFRRHAFILTALTFFVVLFGTIVFVLVPCGDYIFDRCRLIIDTDPGTICAVIITLEVAWSAFCFWLSFRLFAGAKVITAKNIGF